MSVEIEGFIEFLIARGIIDNTDESETVQKFLQVFE
jgi:hypothetical protein